MTGTVATRHGITQIGRTTVNTKKMAGTVQGDGKKTRQKDPKGEAEKAKRGSGIQTMTLTKKPYKKERIRLLSNQRFEEKQRREREKGNERKDRR